MAPLPPERARRLDELAHERRRKPLEKWAADAASKLPDDAIEDDAKALVEYLKWRAQTGVAVPRSGTIVLGWPDLRHLADFHSHWDGILPVDELIDLYLKNALPPQEWEGAGGKPWRLPGPPPHLPADLRSEEWMFLRLSAAILLDDGKPDDTTGAVPARGGHLLQYVVMYVWWALYVEVEIYGLPSDLVKEASDAAGEVDAKASSAAKEARSSWAMANALPAEVQPFADAEFFGAWAASHEAAAAAAGAAARTRAFLSSSSAEGPEVSDYRTLHGWTLWAIACLYKAYARSPRRGGLRQGLAVNALYKYLRATKTAPFDDAYVARGSLIKLLGHRRKPFDDATVGYLVDCEQIRYLQVSQPCKKIAGPAEAVERFNTERREKGYPEDQITVHWLALIATHRQFLDAGRTSAGRKEEDPCWSTFMAHTDEAIDAIAKDGNVRGVDWAGPEFQKFDPGRAREAVEYTLKSLDKTAGALGRPLIFRPHVGEGSSLQAGESPIERNPKALVEAIRRYFNELLESPARDEELARSLCGHRLVRQVLLRSEVGHHGFNVLATPDAEGAAERATHNVRALIDAVEGHYRERAHPEVKIRFGHVTHVRSLSEPEEEAARKEAEALEKMARLRIAADINLSSNLRTGALAYLRSLEEADDVKARSQEKWSWDLGALRRQHSIVALCKAGVTVVLGSDGQGVESSTMPNEYLLAYRLLKDVFATRPFDLPGDVDPGLFGPDLFRRDLFREVVEQNTFDQELRDPRAR